MPANLAYLLALPQWLNGIVDLESAFCDLYQGLTSALPSKDRGPCHFAPQDNWIS
jgi:hypothetical protein